MAKKKMLSTTVRLALNIEEAKLLWGKFGFPTEDDLEADPVRARMHARVFKRLSEQLDYAIWAEAQNAQAEAP